MTSKMNMPVAHDESATRSFRLGNDSVTAAYIRPARVTPEDGGDDVPAISIPILLSAIHRNRWIVGAVVAVGIVIAIALTLLSTPIYRATASLQINQQSSTILQGADVQPITAISDTSRFLETQSRVLKSRSLASRVVDNLKLAGDNGFLAAMGARTSSAQGDATMVVAQRRETIIALLLQNLTIELPISSRVADISFQSPDAKLAARVANTYANSYIQETLDGRMGASHYAREFLKQQIAESRLRLERSEQDLIAYANQSGVIDTAQSGGDGAPSAPSLSAANLVAFNGAYAQARSLRIQAEEKWRRAQQTSPMALPEVLADETVQGLVRTRAEKRASLDQLRERYVADYPQIGQAAANVAGLTRAIDAQVSVIREAIRQSYQLALSQEASLITNVADAQRTALTDQAKRIRYNVLKNEVETNRTFHNTLLQRSREIGAAAGMTLNNISIVDEAQEPRTPVYPRPIRTIAIALFLSIAAAIILVLLKEAFRDVIHAPHDMSDKLGLPLLGTIPLVDKGETVSAALNDAKSSLAEAYHSARTGLEFATAAGIPKVLLFTSTKPGEGKTTSAIAVARSIASTGRSVVLIDGDQRRPSLHRSLGLANEVGFSNLLTGQAHVDQVVQADGMPNLDLITAGPIPPNPVELLSGEALARAIAALSVYDVIVLDSPPVMGLADAMLYAHAADGVVFVIESGQTRTAQVKGALRRLAAVGAPLTGVLLTKFDIRTAGYGYGYDEYYAYRDNAPNAETSVGAA